MVQLAIETVRIQADLPEDVEVKFVEKRESSIPDFYTIKLLVIKADQVVPMMVYVDRAADKVIVGSLFIRGENVTRRESASSGIPKIDVGYLETGKT